MSFDQIIRPRRLRGSKALRNMTREVNLRPSDFIYPLFVLSGSGVKKPIEAMAGQYQLSPDMAAELAAEIYGLGVSSVILFGLPDYKDACGSAGADPEGPVQKAIKAIKQAVPDMVVVTDVCLCEYTDHGHCGLIKDGAIDNDSTLPLLADQALSHVQAGADIVAPSDMMDGRVAAIRMLLDGEGFENIPIMSYSVKYASSFYGPFREAAGCAPQFGDRKSYQMDPARRREAMLELELDIAEGADIVMVKPAGPYLDIIRDVRDNCVLPVAAYQVSGEYAMLMAAVKAGLLDEKGAGLESLLSIKRAGADLIITYLAPQAARWLREE
ncbi:porphobilinogen synthase [Deltaproteobacteria bacterium OttesenSCG-928-K17]|nr:porphobilinogen synthase [Deltaproteobacteria bacterium OttesenSCG-928-K17]